MNVGAFSVLTPETRLTPGTGVVPSILQAMSEPRIWGSWFRDPATWRRAT
jgi:hypothetical protein